MKIKAFAYVVIRLFALLLILWSINYLGIFLASLVSLSQTQDGTWHSPLWSALVPLTIGLMNLALALFLLLQTRIVLGWVTTGLADEEAAISIDMSAAARIAYAVAGMFFLVFGLEDVLTNVVVWHFTERARQPQEIPFYVFDGETVIAGVVKVIVGTILIVRHGRGLWRGESPKAAQAEFDV